MSQVGFVGAGQMGEPMVHRLLRAGHRVTVYARKPAVRERLRGAGAHVVDSVAEVAASEVVIVCVFSDDQLTNVLDNSSGLLAAADAACVVVSHTTGTVATVRGLAEQYPHGPTLLDGPVSGSADGIAAGALTVLLGGPAAAVATARPVLAAYADTVVETGELGSALNVKLVNNALFAANAQVVAAAVAVGRRLGIADDDLLRAVSACSGRSYAADAVARTGGLHLFEQAAAPFLRKDVAACLAAAAAGGVELGQLATVIHDGPLELSDRPRGSR